MHESQIVEVIFVYSLETVNVVGWLRKIQDISNKINEKKILYPYD